MTLVQRCEPELSQIVGGWLAKTPPNHMLSIAVVGATPDEARGLFTVALDTWEDLLGRTQYGDCVNCNGEGWQQVAGFADKRATCLVCNGTGFNSSQVGEPGT